MVAPKLKLKKIIENRLFAVPKIGGATKRIYQKLIRKTQTGIMIFSSRLLENRNCASLLLEVTLAPSGAIIVL